ncbi:MAG: tungstate ABC transporter substrate-binding protein WtpA [Candidatus Krumholzibacteriota bacterium]|nr:tungstate ABC transporter substrate-binding protein WtpA [Candidatus Krumholzibacteriota bacterium]
MRKIGLTVISLIMAVQFVSCSCGDEGSARKRLIIFHAGSLSVPFAEIAERFEEENPQVEVNMEAAGSRTCARKISELGRRCDVIASADYAVIDALLIPDFASWNIKFASNEMAVAFRDDSREADTINRSNWYDILLKDDVTFGRSDPNADPCGYRTVLTLKLAEKFYGEKGLSEKLLEKDTEFMRPKETDLLGLLESGTIDYMFIYRSVARQHDLRFITLPDEINLKESELKDYYASSSVKISGKKPGEFIERRGAPMVYGVTIPDNAPSPGLALEFVEYLLEDSKGQKIMSRNGQPSVVPSPAENYENIPDELKAFVLPAEKIVGEE